MTRPVSGEQRPRRDGSGPSWAGALDEPVTGEFGPLRRFDIRGLGDVVYESRAEGAAEVAVVIPLYNYAHTVAEALESVIAQDVAALAIIVIDDCSTDKGGQETIAFLERHAARFTVARVVQHRRNQGLSMARNSGIAWSNEPYLFMLDADNRLRPPAVSRLLAALQCSGAAFAYSQLRWFGDEEGIGIADLWEPARLAIDNYIDAIALIRRDALLMTGGYAALADGHGWEDYDLWCRFAELGLEGVFLPELLCDYRVHGASMLRTRTNVHYDALMAEMRLRHPELFRGRPIDGKR
jgi:glycosyltransferase involved in cell wall biosynthesis